MLLRDKTWVNTPCCDEKLTTVVDIDTIRIGRG
jgi:hypothetical protein